MRTKDQQFLEEAYQQIVRQGEGYGTPLRPNYSFSQIKDDAWKGDSRFHGFSVNFPDKQSWQGTLKFSGKTIDLEGKGQDVYVDGKKLSFNERINLKDYIIKHYADGPDRSDKFSGSPAFTGSGTPVK